MAKYNPEKFINILNKKISGSIPICPFCGGQKYTSTDSVASILIGDDTSNLNLGPHVPSGMIICENCGRIEFFALGVLGLMEDSQKDGK